MIKWAVIGQGLNAQRFEFLGQWLRTHGTENELRLCEVDGEGFTRALEDCKKKCQSIRIEAPFREKLVEQSTHLTSLVASLQSADALIYDGTRWWPRSILYPAIARMSTRRFKNIDFNSSVLIVGSGAAARTFVVALAKAGFKNFNLTAEDSQRAQKCIEQIKRRFFGLQVRFVASDELTLLPGEHQVMVNTIPASVSSQMTEDLYYFNYLRIPGVVIDLNIAATEASLVTRASEVGAVVVNGIEMAAWSDVFWAEYCFAQRWPVEEYTRQLASAIKGK